MIIVTDATDLSRIAHPGIRQLVVIRLQQLGGDFSDSTEIIIVEADDAASEIEQAAGFPILSGLFDGLPYTDLDFQPCSEILEEHHHEQYTFYEMVFSSGEDGAVAIFIPDQEGVDADLLAMCRAFATPASNPIGISP